MNNVQGNKHTRADHTDGVNKNIFFTGENDAGDSQYNGDKLKPCGMMKVVQELRYDLMHYSASATTSLTSGIIRFIMPSIPALRVIIEDGQPEQEPCSIRLTTPSL